MMAQRLKMRSLNNKGIAVITALMFTLIILALIIAVLAMVNQGTKSSGAMKVYRNTTEAAYGGSEIVMKDVIPRLFANVSTSLIRADYNQSSFNKLMAFGSSACIKQKRDFTNSGSNWNACVDKSIDASKSPDMTFQLVGTNNQSFTVYSKIVDTVTGVEYPEASSGAVLLGGGVTAGGNQLDNTNLLIPHYVYRVEITSQKTDNPKENAKVSVLYEY